ncbi:hypothetical protein GGR51DRAFT_566998 [Nemania sp. FL0031]|nr:hypothetical protein GGR51DRAFT_566998 [Nemania sp. FL0031]
MAARPRAAPPPLAGVSWFGHFVRTEDNGRTEVYMLPTGSTACREFMLRLSMNQDEAILAAANSSDILFKVAASDNLADVQAKLIRREGYFRAILIQSRGINVQAPVLPCRDGPRSGCASHNGSPFVGCRTAAPFAAGAYRQFASSLEMQDGSKLGVPTASGTGLRYGTNLCGPARFQK